MSCFCPLDSVALYLDVGVIFLAIRSWKSVYSQYLPKQLLQFTNPLTLSNFGYCSFFAIKDIKVTFVVFSSKNIVITVYDDCNQNTISITEDF